ncbi:hypothetical protein [Jiangella asiatica]|uniref:Uncharacterized protein n=1 Tax=Jiangella asiatica TaxID=2530372 RepID=A0A4R5CY79_9ACTN|nr:hypothetical protein [Jiangella asiatica]TDE02813.1 hypothetical protein E1269_21210 [Jiangella asiatica]
MSNQTPTIPPVPQPPATKRRRWPWIAAIVLALFAGVGIGSASGETGTTAMPEPQVVTETVTETVTEEVAVTPDACLNALDAAEAVISHAQTAIGRMGEGFEAAASFDISGLDELTAWLDEQTPVVRDARAEYDTRAAECRSAE